MQQENTPAYTVVIPTQNAEHSIGALIRSLMQQTVKPEEILIVDSSSEDRTASMAKEAGATVHIIDKKAFDHGGTRDWAFRQTKTPFVVFMTQDALPKELTSIESLLAPLMKNPQIAAVGGRQIAYPTASRYEQLVRQHNYPAESRTWGREQIDILGIRAFLLSNVFAAYRKSAYLATGGFDHPILTNEDMLMTQKLLEQGFLVTYAGDASVYHSHDYTWKQQYRRNYMIGQTLQRFKARFCNVQEYGEGTELAFSVMKALMKERRFWDCIRFASDCSARMLGNRMGKRAEKSIQSAREG